MSWLRPLIDEVKHTWSQTGRAYNLAKATPCLRDGGVVVEDHLQGRKLKDAIQEDAKSDLRLVRDPNRPLTWGLVPSGVDVPVDQSSLFEAAKPAPENDEPRYARGVWIAFSKPLFVGRRRFLSISSTGPEFEEVGIGEPLPPSGTEIDAEYIWSPNEQLPLVTDRDKLISSKIKSWATAKGIEIERLLAETYIDRHKTRSKIRIKYIDISGLTEEDKARISIPLDVIEKLRFNS